MDVSTIAVSAVLSVSVAVPAGGLGLAVRKEGAIGLRFDEWRSGAVTSPAGMLAVVAVCVVIGVAVGVRVGQSYAMAAFVVSAVLGLVLAVVDVRRRRLPFLLSAMIYASCLMFLGLTSAATGAFEPYLRSLVAGAGTFVVFLLLALTFAGQIGLGDVFYIGALAVSLGWLGWDHVVLGVAAGLVAQLGVLVIVRLRRRDSVPITMPMAPGLLVGWVLAVLLPVR